MPKTDPKRRPVNKGLGQHQHHRESSSRPLTKEEAAGAFERQVPPKQMVTAMMPWSPLWSRDWWPRHASQSQGAGLRMWSGHGGADETPPGHRPCRAGPPGDPPAPSTQGRPPLLLSAPPKSVNPS